MLCSNFPLTNEHPLCLTQEEWMHPKSVFNSLFDYIDCVDLKKLLRRWLKVVCMERTVPKKNIQWIDDVHEQLLRVLEAGYLLNGEEKSTLPDEIDLMDTRWWLGRGEKGIPFDYFPRSLSKKEYCNPYRVFYTCRATYTLQEWRLLLRDCFTTGASTDLLYEVHSFDGALDAYKLLPKLVDAAYLVHVREFRQKKDMVAPEERVVINNTD